MRGVSRDSPFACRREELCASGGRGRETESLIAGLLVPLSRSWEREHRVPSIDARVCTSEYRCWKGACRAYWREM